MLRLGAIYPQTEFPSDPSAVRDYAQTVEGLGYHHLLAYEHVLGANPERPDRLNGPYSHQHTFHEPFVLFSFIAALTVRLELTTGILVLPQRQTALVAKQAASLDVLSGGRLRLGVGNGWNHVEYQALGQDFHTRGRRMEEQVLLMHRLWSEPLVTFEGRWHTVSDAGLNPLPVQRPIPVWFGGHAEVVLERAARLGEGWMPNYRTPQDALPWLEKLDGYLARAGRSRQQFGVEARCSYGSGDLEALVRLANAWQAAGATHLSINTMGLGFTTPQQHLDALTKFAQAMELL